MLKEQESCGSMESYKEKYLNVVEDNTRSTRIRMEKREVKIIESDKFKKIVEKISRIKDDVEEYSYCLKKSELNLLCMYLPSNIHKVDVTKIYEIINIRLDFKMATILYNNWQNNYFNKDNIQIFECILANESILYEFKRHFKISPLEIIHWINNEDVEMSLSRYLARGKNGTIQEYKKALLDVGIKSNSRLFKKCVELFYFVCQSEEYYRIGDEQLVEIIKKMSKKTAKMMLFNMLDRLDTTELRDYSKTARLFRSLFGYYGQRSYISLFDKVDDKLEKKYREWTNYIELNDMIKDEKRLDFWLPYIHYGDVKANVDKKAVIMRFYNFVVVEFSGNNPTYWFNNVYYDQVIKGLINGSSTTEELINWFNTNSKYIKKREHKMEMRMLDRMWMNNMLGIHLKFFERE